MPFTVVLPIYNEQDSLENILFELCAILESWENLFEIIIVNDGSKDNSKVVIEEIIKINKNIFLLDLDKNYGQSYAIMEGVKIASFDKIVIMDGDGQYNPNDIQVIYKMLIGDIRLVCGIRDNRKDPFLYRKVSLIGNFLIAWFFNMKIVDLGCGLKIGYKEDFMRIPYFKHVHRYFQIIYYNSSLPFAQTVIDHRCRLNGRSKYSLMKVFNIIPRFIWIKYLNLKLT